MLISSNPIEFDMMYKVSASQIYTTKQSHKPHVSKRAKKVQHRQSRQLLVTKKSHETA